jgi:NADH pyrophosphatase NudC (nudix superfamily)
MDLGSIFTLLALLILVAAFIIRPLLERKSITVTEDEQKLSSLLAHRDRVLDALQELDFDYKLGKIPESDYPISRTKLLQQGAEVLKMLDTHQAQPGTQISDALESAIAARREQMLATAGNGNHIPNTLHHPDDDIEAMLASRRRARKNRSAGFCAQCGHPTQANDKFCSKCGANVK